MKGRAPIYFQKRYCLVVHSLLINQRIALTSFSGNSCEREGIEQTCTYNLNQILYINCIDVIKDGVTTTDNEARLYFSAIGDKAIKKNDIASVRFDMSQEKIVKPQSSVIFSKELRDGKGTLNYKFINLKTKTLTQEEFQAHRHKRSQLEVSYSRDEHSVKIDELMKLLSDKDDMINKLGKRVENLLVQNRKRQEPNPSQLRQNSKEKAINLHVKVNTVNESIRRQNEKMTIKLRELQERLIQYEQQALDYSKEKEIYEREVNMLRKQNQQLEKMNETKVRVKGRNNSFVAPGASFMRNSNTDPYVMNQSNADWESQQGPTKITINEPVNRSRSPSFLRQESEISNKGKSGQQSQNKLNSKSSMLASNYIPHNGSESNMPFPAFQDKQHSSEINQSNALEADREDELALERRISMQKDDLKWTSAIFDRNEAIQILKKKLQFKANEVTSLEKEVEKVKIMLKKKELEIKEMKRQSKKNLIIGEAGSSKDLLKIEQQFEKMQAQHDSQKVRLEQEVERLEKDRLRLDKEVKRLSASLTEKTEREKTAEAKYTQLKKFTQKKEEEFIEYKEKAKQYEIVNLRNKELEGAMKNMEAKCDMLDKQQTKMTDMYNRVNARLKEVELDWNRIKRAERDFQLAKNQNITYLKSIESYENRYNQLKKYCIKIEGAYNKFVVKRQKGPNESMTPDQIRQNKEIQEKFSQLSKKMGDCELTYYKQQIQDLTLEKGFLSVFFEKKLLEQKDKINENKMISEEEKKIQIEEKEKEIERALVNKQEEMKIRIKKLERSYEEANLRINEGRESGINRPIPEQLRILEKKLSMITQREQERINERRNLKQTILQLNDELKKMSTSVVQLQVQSQTLSKNSSKNLLQSMVARDGRPINSLIEEVKQRGQSVQQKMFQDKVKANTQLMKENSDMKTKISRMQMEFEKVEKKAQQRQRQLDLTFKKSESDFKLKNDRLSQQIEKLTAQLDMLKQKFSDSQSAVSKISQETTNLSYEIETKEQQIQKLEEKIIFYEERMEEYEKSERMMLDEVSEIKKNAEQNQQELFNLIETRSDNFAKIEKVKEVEIQKLRGIIKELQVKLQAEMFENIKSKDKIEQMKTNCDRMEKQTQEKLENQKIDLQNKEAAYDQLYLKEFHLSKQNEILQQNLLQISTQIENKETQIATLTYQLTTLNKQLEIYRKQSQNFEDLQAKYKDDIKGLQLLLDDKLQQIRSFEDKYKHLQMEIEYSAKDMQRIVLSNIKAESEAKEYQEKYMAEREEIIHIKQQYAMLELQVHKNEMFFNNQQQENEQLKKKITELEAEVSRLNEAASKQSLKVSRRVSKQADQFDCPSPGRRNVMPRRTGTLEVPEVSSIGAGGITPILPTSPNPLVRKLSENPFQPKEELRKTKMLRGTSIQGIEFPDKNDEIAIHVEQPVIQPMKSNRNSSNVQIQFDEGQDSIRFSNLNALKSSFRKPTQAEQIREDTEENQENSGGFGHNIELGDSRQEEQDRQYIDQIQELQRQLIHSNEENQKLNIEIIELTKKVDELSQLQQKNLNRSQPGSLGVSRRKPTLQLPSYPKEIERQSSEGKNDRQAEPSIHRSNSGLQLNTSREASRRFVTTGTIGNNLGQIQQQYQAAELQIQYLNNELNAVKNELDEHMKNNERLIEQAELCRETIQELHEKLEEAHFQIEQNKHYLQFQQLYNREKEEVASLMLKIQELNSQIFEKQAHISTLMNENGDIMQQVNEAKVESVNVYDHKAKLQHKVKELTQIIHKLKVQYRKYEQSSELQLVRLNETIDDLKQKLKEKDDEITVLGQEYLQLEAKKDELCSHLQERDKYLSRHEFEQNQIENKCNQLANQLSKTDENRQNLYRTIKQLQLQITQKEERIKTVANDSAMTIKKYEIKLEASKQEIQNVQDKYLEKEKTITILKNEIALYNEQCIQLKALNDQLTYQSTKVEKELKDIMTTYSAELDSYKEIIQSQEKEIANLKSVVREKEIEYHSLLKNFRNAQKERDNFQSEYIETKNSLEKMKNSKMKESNELFIQIQYKNNEIESMKNRIEQINNELQSKSDSTKKQSQKYQFMLQSYKEKLGRYESLMQEFQADLKKVEERPTSEAHEQVIFENQLLRNRIEELQEQLYSKSDTKQKEEVIYMQFRKYKANKEREIQDLQSQMEKYGIKINELEESTFFLKRENEALRRENHSLSEMKENFRIECEDLRESLHEMEKELQFYKKRKLLDMQKLLNDTQ